MEIRDVKKQSTSKKMSDSKMLACELRVCDLGTEQFASCEPLALYIASCE